MNVSGKKFKTDVICRRFHAYFMQRKSAPNPVQFFVKRALLSRRGLSYVFRPRSPIFVNAGPVSFR